MTNYAIVHLPLDDFLSQFLYGSFPQPSRSPNFQFPRSHDMEQALQVLSRPTDTESNTEGLRVQFSLPEWKEQAAHYTFTKKGIAIILRRIRNYYYIVAHDFLAARRHDGYEIKECIYLFLHKYNIEDTETNYERVKKDFDRWRNRQAAKKYKKNRRKKIQECPLDS